MRITARIEVHTLRRRIVIYGAPTLNAIQRFIAKAVRDYGAKVMTYRIEFDGDSPERKDSHKMHYLITSGLPFQPPDAE